MKNYLHPETYTASTGIDDNDHHHAVVPPLYLSANYAWNNPLSKPGYDYSRSGNPTRTVLEKALCNLEHASRCVVTATGMAAVDLILCLLKPGDLLIAPHDCYGGTHRLLSSRAEKGQFDLEFVDQTNPDLLATALARKPKLLLIETPSNPLLRVTDIRNCVKLAQRAGTLVAADNTFLSPALQNPLLLGCDIVIHSTTKLINGHSDVIGGAVLTKDKELGETLSWWANCTGVTGSAFDSYLTLRGLRTLYSRIERQQKTAQQFIKALQGCGSVKNIYYPGIASHPGHDIAAAQQAGFGTMLSVEFNDDINVAALLQQFKIFTTAESLGGFESLACIPACMTHASMPEPARKIAGISDTLVRFSIGLEHVDDLTHDLFSTLDAVTGQILSNIPKPQNSSTYSFDEVAPL